MPRAVADREYHRGLDQKVDRQGSERVADQPQAAQLALLATA